MEPVASLFAAGVGLVWPRRAQIELLLDLGERKRWTDSDAAVRFDEVKCWLLAEGVIALGEGQRRPDGVDVRDLKAGLAALAPAEPSPRSAGASVLVTFLALAVGSAPKTLANSLTRGLRSSRPDHRWLLVLHDIVEGTAPLETWLFHRRSPATLAAALRPSPQPHAADALLLLSLIALWQRRRPTVQARGNRGTERARRLTPKPIAALTWQLITPGQVPHLINIALEFGDERGTALGLLAVECALTEAHLAPHPSRGNAADQQALVDSGEGFLTAAADGLASLSRNTQIDPIEHDVVAYRIARMRAWRDGAPAPAPSPAARSHAYVAACLALDDLRAGRIDALPDIHASTPGLAMLLPQLRAAGARILP